jgi:hypothetical protein
MIFRELLDSKTILLSKEFEKLFDQLKNNKINEDDLSLIALNGFKLPSSEIKYFTGPNSDGHSFYTHNDFICDYLEDNTLDIDYSKYIESTSWNTERANELLEESKKEFKTIQYEMFIYLKIWESDYFIKLLYQIARVLNSEGYDWDFKIKTIDDNDKNSHNTGKREDIIRKKARNRFEKLSPLIYQTIKNAYRSQIRNSIAHSNYDFSMRNIVLNNFVKSEKFPQKISISFNEWIDLFHDTIVIYSEVIRLIEKIENELLLNRK